MSASIASPAVSAPVARASHPSFIGVMRGEWLKVSRQWTFWIMLALMFAGYVLFTLVLSGSDRLTNNLAHQPKVVLYMFMESNLFLLRVFWGMMLIILTARLIGMEYSSGTVRVILARGVGRLELLFAKLGVMALIAVVGGALLLAWSTLLALITMQSISGNLNALNAADATFWADTRAYVATVLISMGVSILMAAGVTSVVRSLAAGVSISIAWFPVDNLSIILLALAYNFTQSDFWRLLSGDFLGLNLNAMGGLALSQGSPDVVHSFLLPLTPVTFDHTLLITGLYAVVFLVAAIATTAIRDVKE